MANYLNALTVKHLTWLFVAIALIAAAIAFMQWQRISEIEAFNQAVNTADTPQTDKQSYEAQYATAYWLAEKGILKESTNLFTKLTQTGTPSQRAAVFHNIGNAYFLKALHFRNNATLEERDQIEFQLNQAYSAYKQALKLDNSNWGTRRNLDRVITLLPENPTPGVGESDSPGLIMGNIPVGLP